MCFPGLSIGIAFWVQVIISFCDTSVFSLSYMGNLALQKELRRAPSWCSNVSLLLKSHILKILRNVFQESAYRQPRFSLDPAIASSTYT